MRAENLLKELQKCPPLSLMEILDAKEQRVKHQQELLKKGGTLISFTLNIAGAVKSFPLFTRAFVEGKRQILRELSYAGIEVKEQQECCDKTGNECFLLVEGPPERIKERMVAIEQSSMLGRLFDIDVMAEGIPKISRSDLGLPPRKCLVCGEKAAACARSQAHPIEEVRARTLEIICDFFNHRTADAIAQAACRALLYEVNVTPKPGLVDRKNNGSHRDMDIFTFADSACTLYPYFKNCAMQGLTAEGNEQELFSALRPLGREAEEQMKRATDGVNTHKGAIFSMGIFCAAAGRMADREAQESKDFGREFSRKCSRELSRLCSQMCGHLMEDFSGIGQKNSLSYGERLYRDYGITGIRGEAAEGFPSVFEVGLPVLEQEIAKGKSCNDAGIAALLALIARVQDTNILTRSDRKTLCWAQQRAEEVLRQGMDKEQLEQLDREFIEKNISPGGCADLLALCFFFHFYMKDRQTA